jgi:hypothetical protein
MRAFIRRRVELGVDTGAEKRDERQKELSFGLSGENADLCSKHESNLSDFQRSDLPLE